MEKQDITILYIEAGKYPEVKTIPHTLENLQAQVCGTIQIVYPWQSMDACLVCHDEGKLIGLPLNRAVEEIDDAIAGNFFICGLCETEEGGDICGLTPEQIKFFEEKYHFPELFIRSPNGTLVRPCTPAQYDRLMGKDPISPCKTQHEER